MNNVFQGSTRTSSAVVLQKKVVFARKNFYQADTLHKRSIDLKDDSEKNPHHLDYGKPYFGPFLDNPNFLRVSPRK